MKSTSKIHLSDVQQVYSGPEGRLWELLMGEQIHIGGFQSSQDLAECAGIGQGQQGVDFCCATGAGMRFLVRLRNVARMTGVDATSTMLELGRKRRRSVDAPAPGGVPAAGGAQPLRGCMRPGRAPAPAAVFSGFNLEPPSIFDTDLRPA